MTEKEKWKKGDRAFVKMIGREVEIVEIIETPNENDENSAICRWEENGLEKERVFTFSALTKI